MAAKLSNPAAPVTAEELKAHEKDLAGEKMDPSTLVGPITFQLVVAKK
jgi:hypothetical protein